MTTPVMSPRTRLISAIREHVLRVCCFGLLLFLVIAAAGCAGSEGTGATVSTPPSVGQTTTSRAMVEGSSTVSADSPAATETSSVSTSLSSASTTVSTQRHVVPSTTETTRATATTAKPTPGQTSQGSAPTTQPPVTTSLTTSTTARPAVEPYPLSCTFLIDCGNAVKAGLASNRTILARQTVKFKEGETVLVVLKRLLAAEGIPMVSSGSGSSAYVASINGLAEFDCGPKSGWMYNVNGWYPDYGNGAYKLKDGDAVEWRYTCSLGEDL